MECRASSATLNARDAAPSTCGTSALRSYYPEQYHGFPGHRAGLLQQLTASCGGSAVRRVSRLVAAYSPLSLDASILDVGPARVDSCCLSRHGYKNVLGSIRSSITYGRSNVRILKQTIEATPGPRDLIMFNHSSSTSSIRERTWKWRSRFCVRRKPSSDTHSRR